MKSYTKISPIINKFTFYLNSMNFEDFFVLHFPEKVILWQEICESRNHFENPLIGEDHFKLFKSNIFEDYSKRDFTKSFKLNKTSMTNAINQANSNDNGFDSGFISILEKIVAEI